MTYPRGKRYLMAVNKSGSLIIDKKKGYSVRFFGNFSVPMVSYRKMRTRRQSEIMRKHGHWVSEPVQDLVQYVIQVARERAHVKYQ